MRKLTFIFVLALILNYALAVPASHQVRAHVLSSQTLQCKQISHEVFLVSGQKMQRNRYQITVRSNDRVNDWQVMGNGLTGTITISDATSSRRAQYQDYQEIGIMNGSAGLYTAIVVQISPVNSRSPDFYLLSMV